MTHLARRRRIGKLEVVATTHFHQCRRCNDTRRVLNRGCEPRGHEAGTSYADICRPCRVRIGQGAPSMV